MNHDVHVIERADSGMENEVLAMEKAKEVGDTLSRHYPGHLWAVSWQGGVLVVKNLAISTFYGFVLKYADSHSAKHLAKQAVLAGGELLERAGMKVGSWDGQFAAKLEGSDPRFFQPTPGH
ncbi:MAG: hypothetical protein JWR07_1921 [Nevskia sp.]|nr:hypothetical protein [Nevskia sp.]